MYGSAIPEDILTSKRHDHRRVQVDVGQTGFTEGREFRSFIRFDLATNGKLQMRFVSPVPFIIWDESITIVSGEIDSTASRTASDVAGVWTPADAIERNIMPDRPTPFYAAQARLQSGGTFTPGAEVGPPILIKTANATGQQTSVPSGNSRERGLAAGTYYITTTAIAAAKGVYILEWEEKP